MIKRPLVPSPRGGVVLAGLRWVLLGINIFLSLTGIVMVILGVKLEKYKQVLWTTSSPPDLWWLGLMPLTIGFVGLISTVIGNPKWLLAWAIYSTITGIASYVFFVRTGCFDPEIFGVTMRIYGEKCSVEDEHRCTCKWYTDTITVSRNHSCDIIRYTTSIYLSQMVLMTLCLAASIIGCFLASVSTCAKCCVIQNEEEQSLLPTGTTGFQSTPSLQRHSESGCVYMTDYVPPRTTKTYLSKKSHDNSML